MPRRSASWRSTGSASRTVPARTATSAVASRRCGSFATPGWPFRSRRTAPRRRRRSTSSRRSAPRSSAARARAGRPDALTGCRRARARDARRSPRARNGRPDRIARARKAGRSGRHLARELSVRSRGRSCYGSRPGRLPGPCHSYSGGRRTALPERNVPMARFDKSSTKRPKQNAAVAATRSAKRSTAPSIEDTMFFPRLRRHAKWMFVFLAVALGGGFVLFGVGAGGTGVGDILRGGGATSGVPSISSSAEEDRAGPEERAGVDATSRRRCRPTGRPTRRSTPRSTSSR